MRMGGIEEMVSWVEAELQGADETRTGVTRLHLYASTPIDWL